MNNLVNHINSFMPYAMSLTKDINNAKDLLQDLAVQVFRKPEYYLNKQDADIKNLFRLILRWAHTNRWNRDNHSYDKKPHRTILIGCVEFNQKITVENDAWGLLQKRELQQSLLKLKYRTGSSLPFRLRIDGYKTTEIAEITGLKKESIDNSIKTTRNFLRKQLAA